MEQQTSESLLSHCPRPTVWHLHRSRYPGLAQCLQWYRKRHHMGSSVTPTDNCQPQEPPIRSNHARRMRYDHGPRSHNTCLQQECQRPLQHATWPNSQARLLPTFQDLPKTRTDTGSHTSHWSVISCCVCAVQQLYGPSQSQSPGMAHHPDIPRLWTNVPVIGPIPAQLISYEYNDTITFTKPHEIITITSILPVSWESICWSELTDDTHLAVYAVSTQHARESPT